MFCSECGEKAGTGNFCTNCGFDLPKSHQTNSDYASNSQITPKPSEQFQSLAAQKSGSGAGIIIGFLFAIPAIMFSFPAFSILGDSQCHWVTATSNFTVGGIWSGEAFYCLYEPNESIAKESAYWLGLNPDAWWMPKIGFLALTFGMYALAGVIIRSARK